MREIKHGDYESVLEVGEVFKYIVSSKRQYILIALSSNDTCDGCAFNYNSRHPLEYCSCNGNGLNCSDRIFKPAGDILEDL